MRRIPTKLRREMQSQPFYKKCALQGIHGHECGGNLTIEHAIIYAGRQLNELWALVPLCAKAHAVNEYQDAGTMIKDMNVWVALNRATEAELKAVSKSTDYTRELNRLNGKYGPYLSEKIMPSVHVKGLDAYKHNWICKFCDTINLNLYRQCNECGSYRYASKSDIKY